jgi:hypothetical protein
MAAEDELVVPTVPEARPEDPEDVSWALSTAEAMWARGDHLEGIKWVRRAAEAASEAEADTRALELAKAAADLTSLVARRSRSDESSPRDVGGAAAGAGGAGAGSAMAGSAASNAPTPAQPSVQPSVQPIGPAGARAPGQDAGSVTVAVSVPVVPAPGTSGRPPAMARNKSAPPLPSKTSQPPPAAGHQAAGPAASSVAPAAPAQGSTAPRPLATSNKTQGPAQGRGVLSNRPAPSEPKKSKRRSRDDLSSEARAASGAPSAPASDPSAPGHASGHASGSAPGSAPGDPRVGAAVPAAAPSDTAEVPAIDPTTAAAIDAQARQAQESASAAVEYARQAAARVRGGAGAGSGESADSGAQPDPGDGRDARAPAPPRYDGEATVVARVQDIVEGRVGGAGASGGPRAESRSAAEWDALPTQDLTGAELDHVGAGDRQTTVGAIPPGLAGMAGGRDARDPRDPRDARDARGGARMDARADARADSFREVRPPASSMIHDPEIQTSQAVRVVVWRDPNGVHVAPAGSLDSRPNAITIDAVLVALEPTADLTAWLSKKDK